MKKFLVMFAAATLMVGSASATTLLSDLLAPGATLEVGDKIFSNFTFDRNCSGTDPLCLPVDATGINVIGLDIDPLHHGLRFDGTFLAAGPLSIANFTIGYTVTVADWSDNYAKDMELALSGLVIQGCDDPGDFCTIAIGETLRRTDDNSVIAQLQVTNQSLDASVEFDPIKSFKVIKDISLVVSASQGDFVKFSVLDQIVSQTGGEIPEPGTYALMGAGLLGLAAIRRRKA